MSLFISFGKFATTLCLSFSTIFRLSRSSIALSKFSRFEAVSIFSFNMFSISSSFPFKKRITFFISSPYSSFVTLPVQGARQRPNEKFKHSLFAWVLLSILLLQVRILNAIFIVFKISRGSIPEMYGPKYRSPSRFFTHLTISRRGKSSFMFIFIYGNALPSFNKML